MENSQLPLPHPHCRDFDTGACTPDFKKQGIKKHDLKADGVGSLQKVVIYFRWSQAEGRGKIWGQTASYACEGKKGLGLISLIGKQHEGRSCLNNAETGSSAPFPDHLC